MWLIEACVKQRLEHREDSENLAWSGNVSEFVENPENYGSFNARETYEWVVGSVTEVSHHDNIPWRFQFDATANKGQSPGQHRWLSASVMNGHTFTVKETQLMYFQSYVQKHFNGTNSKTVHDNKITHQCINTFHNQYRHCQRSVPLMVRTEFHDLEQRRQETV